MCLTEWTEDDKKGLQYVRKTIKMKVMALELLYIRLLHWSND